MSRLLKDWLKSYVDYASVTEAPKRMHFWAGVGAIAGAVRRKVWLDMKRFMWVPSFYIVYVAPPGIVAKSTTMDISMNLLREVPGIKFGPDSITWQGLATMFAAASESFEFPIGSGDWWPMSPLSFASGELGSLVDLQNRDMVNLLIELWDGKKKYDKQTKMSGNDSIEAPWINIQGCTTPNWIADNMPRATVGGGFSSRCVFIYADKKDKYVPWPDEAVDKNDKELQAELIHDLEHMATMLCGPFKLSAAARAWGGRWYIEHWETLIQRGLDEETVIGYATRKQTHMVKLAMVLSIAQGDSLEITADNIQLAKVMLDDLEADMPKVFARIGRSEVSQHADKILGVIQRRGKMPYDEIWRVAHSAFPDLRDMENIIAGLIRSGLVGLEHTTSGAFLKALTNGHLLTPVNSNPPPSPPAPNGFEDSATPNSSAAGL